MDGRSRWMHHVFCGTLSGTRTSNSAATRRDADAGRRFVGLRSTTPPPTSNAQRARQGRFGAKASSRQHSCGHDAALGRRGRVVYKRTAATAAEIGGLSSSAVEQRRSQSRIRLRHRSPLLVVPAGSLGRAESALGGASRSASYPVRAIAHQFAADLRGRFGGQRRLEYRPSCFKSVRTSALGVLGSAAAWPFAERGLLGPAIAALSGPNCFVPLSLFSRTTIA